MPGCRLRATQASLVAVPTLTEIKPGGPGVGRSAVGAVGGPSPPASVAGSRPEDSQQLTRDARRRQFSLTDSREALRVVGGVRAALLRYGAAGAATPEVLGSGRQPAPTTRRDSARLKTNGAHRSNCARQWTRIG